MMIMHLCQLRCMMQHLRLRPAALALQLCGSCSSALLLLSSVAIALQLCVSCCGSCSSPLWLFLFSTDCAPPAACRPTRRAGGDIVKQLPQEAKRFQNIDKNYTKIVTSALETLNVVNT